MKRLVVLVILLMTAASLKPLSANDDCPTPDASLAPSFAYDSPDGRPNVEPLIQQVTDYLNAGGAPDELPAYFEWGRGGRGYAAGGNEQ